MSILKIKRMYNDVVLPKYAKDGDSGMDICAYLDDHKEYEVLLGGERKLIFTGLKTEIEPGYEIQIRPRSGLALKKGITVLNSPGTIDSAFRGVLGVIVINHSNKAVRIYHGDKIAQAVLAKIEKAEIIEVDELSETDRGEGGFGSTGN